MPREVIDKIKAAEKEAETIIKAGEAEAHHIAFQARHEAKELISRRGNESEAEAKKLHEKIMAKTEEGISRIKTETEVVKLSLRKSGLKNMNQAVEFIIEKIKSIWQ